MIGYFPVEYPDETLPSLVSRYARHTFARTYSAVARELFGTNYAKVSSHFQFRLGAFVDRTHHILGYSADEIIDRFTLFHFYSLFLDPDQSTTCRELMKMHKCHGGVTAAFGGPWSWITKGSPKICPICAKEQIKKCGELYFMRVHQIPFIYVCPFHHCHLLDPDNKERRQIQFASEFMMGNIQDGLLNDVRYVRNKSIVSISEYLAGIFDGSIKVNLQHREKLIENGYYNSSGCRRKILLTNFERFYEPVRALYFDPWINRKRNDKGVDLLPRVLGHVTNPMRQILISYFLEFGPKIKRIASLPAFHDRHLFGAGPWRCVNRTCKHFQKKVIEEGDFYFKPEVGRTIGRFCCPYCQMKYAKSFKKNSDKWIEVSKIVDYGFLWRRKLVELINEALRQRPYGNLRRLAYILGVGLWTVKSNAQRLGIKHCWKKVDLWKSKKVPVENLRTGYRQKFLKKKARYKRRVDLYYNDRGLYNWLSRNDREWFFEELDKEWPSRGKPLRDHEEEDEKFLALAKKKYAELLEKNFSSQITKTTVLKLMGVPPRFRRLPRVKDFLNNGMETVEAYQKRRLDQVIRDTDWTKPSTVHSILYRARIYKASESLKQMVEVEIQRNVSRLSEK